jgi:hypothetical protein
MCRDREKHYKVPLTSESKRKIPYPEDNIKALNLEPDEFMLIRQRSSFTTKSKY